MKWKIVLSGLLFLFTLQMKGQEINGIVYDAKFDRALSNVTVLLTDSHYGSVSDKSGLYKIVGIQPGKYKLLASMVGYLIYEKEIEVTFGSTLNINIYLQPTNISLNNEIVISARRVESDEFSSPEAISVLNSKSLQQESARSTPEAIMGTTGAFLQKTNHGGGSPIIRGLIGNQNLLMVDGIRLNNATFRYGPNQYLSTIEPLSIQKIEVVRGAGSVLYGSDALGGVLQVFTKDASFSNAGYKAGGSVYGKLMSDEMEKTGRGEIELSGEKAAFIGSFTYHDFGDIVPGDTLEKESPTGYKEYSADAKLHLRIHKNNELIIAYQYDRQNDVPRYDKIITGYTKYHFDPQIRQLGYARLKTNFDNKWFRQVNFTTSLNQSDETRVLQKNGQTKITDEHDLVNTFGGMVEVYSHPCENWVFTSGVECYYDKVESNKIEKDNGTETEKRGYYPDGSSSTNIAVFSSHTFSLNSFDISMGGRFNTYKIEAGDAEFGDVNVSPSALVGNVSVVYKLNPHHNVIASAYTAFRAPNLNDLSSFGSFNAGIEVPNPDLKPERSFNTEIGWKTRYDRFSGSFFLYRNNLKDLIERKKATYNGHDSIDGEKVYKKENFSKAYIQGVEAEFQYEFVSWLSGYGNITYTYGQNETADEPLTRMPPLYGRFGMYFTCPKGFWVRSEWLSAGKQSRLSEADKGDSRIPEGGTPGWNVFNLRVGYNWKWIKVTAGLNNLFDEAYRTHGSGVDGYGRSYWLGVKVEF
jgi:outer membrane receptor protein involved in Fe transport